MLFNSYEFIFVFLPVVVTAFLLLGKASREWALRWVIAASLFFYGWWRPLNVLIIAPSVLINFMLARLMQRLRKQENRKAALTLLVFGIAFNVAFLGYFKYSNFFVNSINDAFGTKLFLAKVILPLGISFITFQKIAFLVDVQAGRIESFTLQDYCLFVLFFPQLIAGPIVHYREMMPQFQRASCCFDKDNFAVGVTLFAFGLFEKVFLADSIASFVTPLYEKAASGGSMALIPAWVAAVGFTFQIYFDFAGYTDMALGAARLFGIKLPPNFNSPLRATSIIDFWQRWHMTLTRFLTAYIYNPLTLWLTRRRISSGRPGFGGRNKSVEAFIELLVFPTLLTMFVAGFWHGAGYTFIVWGVLHGIFLTVNHTWRQWGPRLWRDKSSYERFMQPTGFVITFVCVAASMVIFRAVNLKTATHLLYGMIGLHGIGVSGLRASFALGLKTVALWSAASAFIALLCPNTLQILDRYEPALGWKPSLYEVARPQGRVQWGPSVAWALAMSLIVTIGILNLGGRSEFLYWQF